MFAYIRKVLRWNTAKPAEFRKSQTSLILAALLGLLEDVLFWKKMWLSLSFILVFNLIFFVCVHRQITFVQFILCICGTVIVVDALETWLKHKHRTTFLKRLAKREENKLYPAFIHIKQWTVRKWIEFIHLRETNHTKVFILVNIILGIAFIIGRYVSGYLLIYSLCMFLCLARKVVSPVIRLVRNIQHEMETDCEYESFIPEVSDVDIKLLSIEPEENQVIDEKQSLDYWKPDDVPLEEVSDSSETSSSLVANLSIHTPGTEIETSDSSDDEYIPLVKQKEQLQSTLEVIEPAGTWSSSAYNALWNLKEAVGNIMHTDKESKRKRVSSMDSSDSFELIDKNDLN